MVAKMTVYTKSGRMVTLHFHGAEDEAAADARQELISFSDWTSVPEGADRAAIDHGPLLGPRMVIPYASIDYLEVG